MKKKFNDVFKIFRKTYKGWNEDDPFRQSSVIAYYAIFSLPALLVVIINVAGLFFEEEAVSGEVSRQISGLMGAETARLVEKIVQKAGQVEAGLIPGIIGLVTIILGATGVFVQLQKTLNQIWDVRTKPETGILLQLKKRLFSFGLVLSIGFLLLVSLVISSVLAAASHWLESVLPDVVAYLFYVLEFAVSLGVISFLFALMFKFLPDVKLAWKNIWLGAGLTGLLFLLGKYGLSFYFGKSEPASVYGVAGSVVLIMLWVSYSSMIFFFGAEFTKQFAVFHGMKITPKENAEKIESGREKAPIRPVITIDREYGPDGSGNGETSEKVRGNGSLKKHLREEKKELKLHMHISEQIKKDEENAKENKIVKMKNRKELHQEIARLERLLEYEKADIRDDLSFAHFLGRLLPKALRIKLKAEKKVTVDDYLKNVARKHIVHKNHQDTLVEKIKRYIDI